MENRSNFIKTIIENDLKEGKYKKIVTRFPPEPNGFLHIGHARAIIINFELAKVFGGQTYLRFDDTNPAKEDDLFVKAIQNDVKWLGYEPHKVLYGSNYFEIMYDKAKVLIRKGLAYVDDQNAEEIAINRGTLTQPGIDSEYRNRSVDENMRLFEEMKNGEYQEGSRVLRAKIDMKSPNMNMRDPVIYRIAFKHHHRTRSKWCIYPMYDFAHPLEDAIEGISHSLCSLEFEDHRPLYEWVLKETEISGNPRQIEFGRLSIENTVMSKRHLRQLVESKLVFDWDDPRMPTLSGLRNRGYTANAIRNFILEAGLSKINSTVSNDMLEFYLREDLKDKSKRLMGIVDPLKVTITNYPEGKIEYLEVPFNIDNLELGSRKIPFSRNIYIEQADFMPVKPDNSFKRLSIGDEVRLFHAYFIKCYDVVKDRHGNIIELLVTYDENTKSGSGFNERKPNGTIQFICADECARATFRIYGDLITGSANLSLEERFNYDSFYEEHGYIELVAKEFPIFTKIQLIRDGYYQIMGNDEGSVIVNKTVSLKSSYK